ncbi:hypothetical protein [Tsukamurella soli]|uniref:Uncharacterized protein n=1 Tax=Tsukamurella soli TaxID=644556 RepID=A0ABP8JHB4_9ACTN
MQVFWTLVLLAIAAVAFPVTCRLSRPRQGSPAHAAAEALLSAGVIGTGVVIGCIGLLAAVY